MQATYSGGSTYDWLHAIPLTLVFAFMCFSLGLGVGCLLWRGRKEKAELAEIANERLRLEQADLESKVRSGRKPFS